MSELSPNATLHDGLIRRLRQESACAAAALGGQHYTDELATVVSGILDLAKLCGEAADALASLTPSATALTWIPIGDKLPPIGELSVVLSSRADDSDDLEGIDQYEGSWVIRPHREASEEAIRRWAERHQVTHWMPLPGKP